MYLLIIIIVLNAIQSESMQLCRNQRDISIQ